MNIKNFDYVPANGNYITLKEAADKNLAEQRKRNKRKNYILLATIVVLVVLELCLLWWNNQSEEVFFVTVYIFTLIYVAIHVLLLIPHSFQYFIPVNVEDSYYFETAIPVKIIVKNEWVYKMDCVLADNTIEEYRPESSIKVVKKVDIEKAVLDMEETKLFVPYTGFIREI